MQPKMKDSDLLILILMQVIMKQITKGGMTMHIEHIAMYVCDLEAARDFFQRYFHARANDGYHNQITGFRSYFLTFDHGARLELMRAPGWRTRKRRQTGPAMHTSPSASEAARLSMP